MHALNKIKSMWTFKNNRIALLHTQNNKSTHLQMQQIFNGKKSSARENRNSNILANIHTTVLC